MLFICVKETAFRKNNVTECRKHIQRSCEIFSIRILIHLIRNLISEPLITDTLAGSLKL